MKAPSTLVHLAMLAGIGAFIYAVTRKPSDRVEGRKVDPMKSWFSHVKAKPGSWEAREQVSEWMVKHAEDRQALAFGMNMLHGWLDLDVRGADAAATRKLMSELNPLFRD